MRGVISAILSKQALIRDSDQQPIGKPCPTRFWING